MINVFLFFILVALLVVLIGALLGNISLPTSLNPIPPSRSPHEILGVAPDASVAEIKQAFHSIIKMYHPDHIPQHLAPELRELAETRTKEINEAYRSLLAQQEK